jgi:hypothetical protein
MRSALILVAFLAFCLLMAGLVGLVFGDVFWQLKIWWRKRQARRSLRRADKFAREWNPRPTAVRQFSQASVIGRDQIPARQRMAIVKGQRIH